MQTTIPSGDRLFNWGSTTAATPTGDLLGSRIARSEDIQALVTAQAELNRDGETGIDRVDGQRIVHRWIEAAEGKSTLGDHKGRQAARLAADYMIRRVVGSGHVYPGVVLIMQQVDTVGVRILHCVIGNADSHRWIVTRCGAEIIVDRRHAQCVTCRQRWCITRDHHRSQAGG